MTRLTLILLLSLSLSTKIYTKKKDHTAIIVEANGSTISSSRSAEECPPTRLGLITVIEQSLKQIPIRRTYDLATISRGEVWIYRPMAEDLLLGPGCNQCTFPPPSPSFLPS
jgi:hypothetical protein